MRLLILTASLLCLTACASAGARVGGGTHGAGGSIYGTLVRF
jgi:hypothetical protein